MANYKVGSSEWLENLDEWDKDVILKNPNSSFEDVDEEVMDWLEENNFERFQKLCENGKESILNMMFPDGNDNDD